VVLLLINSFCCRSDCEMTAPSDDKFTLSGGDAEFGSRAKNVFAGLESLEARHVAVESSEAAQRESYSLMKPDPTDDVFSSSSGPSDASNFQVPSRPPPKRIHSSPRPGYETTPSKWKRYDLSDVSASDLTEHSNQKAAEEFFNRFQVPTDDAAQIVDTVTDGDIMKHVFRKPDKKPELQNDASKRTVTDVKHHRMEDAEEDDDETEDVTRTQVLSFADDEPSSAASSKERFRHRCVKRTADRRVRNQITGSDEDEEQETISYTVTTEAHGDDQEIPSVADKDRRSFDSDGSDSDNFSELAQLGSDSEEEEDEDSDDAEREPESHPLTASEVEKYVPEDVDLDSID